MGKKETIVTTDSVQTIPHEYLGCSASSSSCGDDHLQADFEEDELHLIGAEWQKPNDSFLNVKNIQFLILNLILNLLAITWLIHKNYSIDLIGIILITLSGWLWVFCAIIVGKWIIKLREKSMLNGKADDFRNYVVKYIT